MKSTEGKGSSKRAGIIRAIIAQKKAGQRNPEAKKSVPKNLKLKKMKEVTKDVLEYSNPPKEGVLVNKVIDEEHIPSDAAGLYDNPLHDRSYSTLYRKYMEDEATAQSRLSKARDYKVKHGITRRGGAVGDIAVSERPSEKAFFQSAYHSYDKRAPRAIAGGLQLVADTPTIDVYLDAESRAILIGIRGTDDFKDVKADSALIANRLVKTKRYKQDRAVIEKIIQQYSPDDYGYYVSGHSLGGALVNQFKRDFPFIKSAVTYNPAFQTYDLFNQGNNIKRNYVEGDFLYELGGKMFRNARVIAPTQAKGFFSRLKKAFTPKGISSHKLDNFKKLYGMGTGRLIGGADEEEENPNLNNEEEEEEDEYAPPDWLQLPVIQDNFEPAGMPWAVVPPLWNDDATQVQNPVQQPTTPADDGEEEYDEPLEIDTDDEEEPEEDDDPVGNGVTGGSNGYMTGEGQAPYSNEASRRKLLKQAYNQVVRNTFVKYKVRQSQHREFREKINKKFVEVEEQQLLALKAHADQDKSKKRIEGYALQLAEGVVVPIVKGLSGGAMTGEGKDDEIPLRRQQTPQKQQQTIPLRRQQTPQPTTNLADLRRRQGIAPPQRVAPNLQTPNTFGLSTAAAAAAAGSDLQNLIAQPQAPPASRERSTFYGKRRETPKKTPPTRKLGKGQTLRRMRDQMRERDQELLQREAELMEQGQSSWDRLGGLTIDLLHANDPFRSWFYPPFTRPAPRPTTANDDESDSDSDIPETFEVTNPIQQVNALGQPPLRGGATYEKKVNRGLKIAKKIGGYLVGSAALHQIANAYGEKYDDILKDHSPDDYDIVVRPTAADTLPPNVVRKLYSMGFVAENNDREDMTLDEALQFFEKQPFSDFYFSNPETHEELDIIKMRKDEGVFSDPYKRTKQVLGDYVGFEMSDIPQHDAGKRMRKTARKSVARDIHKQLKSEADFMGLEEPEYSPPTSPQGISSAAPVSAELGMKRAPRTAAAAAMAVGSTPSPFGALNSPAQSAKRPREDQRSGERNVMPRRSLFGSLSSPPPMPSRSLFGSLSSSGMLMPPPSIGRSLFSRPDSDAANILTQMKDDKSEKEGKGQASPHPASAYWFQQDTHGYEEETLKNAVLEGIAKAVSRIYGDQPLSVSLAMFKQIAKNTNIDNMVTRLAQETLKYENEEHLHDRDYWVKRVADTYYQRYKDTRAPLPAIQDTEPASRGSEEDPEQREGDPAAQAEGQGQSSSSSSTRDIRDLYGRVVHRYAGIAAERLMPNMPPTQRQRAAEGIARLVRQILQEDIAIHNEVIDRLVNNAAYDDGENVVQTTDWLLSNNVVYTALLHKLRPEQFAARRERVRQAVEDTQARQERREEHGQAVLGERDPATEESKKGGSGRRPRSHAVVDTPSESEDDSGDEEDPQPPTPRPRPKTPDPKGGARAGIILSIIEKRKK